MGNSQKHFESYSKKNNASSLFKLFSPTQQMKILVKALYGSENEREERKLSGETVDFKKLARLCM